MLLLNKRTDGGYQFLMILYCHRKLVFRHFKRRAFFCHGNKLNCVFRIYPENQSTSSRSLIRIFKNLLRKKKVNGNKKKKKGHTHLTLLIIFLHGNRAYIRKNNV